MRSLEIIQEHISVINKVTDLLPEINQTARLCRLALTKGRTIFFLGNGGSAADSQHLAAELVGRFQKERRGLPGVALTTDTSILTAVGNDYGFDQVFVRQVEALVREGDIVFGLSTSGNSPNVTTAIEAARTLGAVTVGMTGANGGRLEELCDICLKVPSLVTARVQEAHILIGHILCEMIDEVESNV